MKLELERFRGEWPEGCEELRRVRAELVNLEVDTWNPLRERSGLPYLGLYERREGWCVYADKAERKACWRHPENPYGAVGHPGGGYWPVYQGVEQRSGHKVFGVWRRI